jgi:hypothetical protein
MDRTEHKARVAIFFITKEIRNGEAAGKHLKELLIDPIELKVGAIGVRIFEDVTNKTGGDPERR